MRKINFAPGRSISSADDDKFLLPYRICGAGSAGTFASWRG